jgi:hypothetical protein
MATYNRGELCTLCQYYPGHRGYCFVAGACIDALYLPCCDCFRRAYDQEATQATAKINQWEAGD